MIVPADPSNPEMNARRSSQRAIYSLESRKPEVQRLCPSAVGLWRTLIFTGDDNSIHIVLLLGHELSESPQPVCCVDPLYFGCIHREWSEFLDGRILASGVTEERKR
jgi:hypothetical protein